MKPYLYVLVCGLALLSLSASTATAASVASTSPEIKEVALTFDDGPYGTSTLQILNILKKEGVPATFFMIGKNVDRYPLVAKEVAADGEEIGNHTYTHPTDLRRLSAEELKKEISDTASSIASTTGERTRLFRPPYGVMNRTIRKRVGLLGYAVVMWNVDPQDWDHVHSTSTVIVERILDHLNDKMIVLFHDGRDTHVDYPRDNLVSALPTVIQDLKGLGYRFVKVSQIGK